VETIGKKLGFLFWLLALFFCLSPPTFPLSPFPPNKKINLFNIFAS